MVLGPKKEDLVATGSTDTHEGSIGITADGEIEGNAYNPMGDAGIQHWQAGFIDSAGVEHHRDNIFFAAVEMTRMPMVLTDPNKPDNPIIFANGAFFDLTKYSKDEVLGRNCRFLQGPGTDPDSVRELRQAVTEQRAVALDILNYKADGSSFWNALFIGPVFDKAGKLLYFFASQMDITRRRTAEHVSLQAQKMEAIGQLTAGLAHDFNNLLHVVSGNLELTKRNIGNPEVAGQFIDKAAQAALKGSRLTHQLLTFARKQRLQPEELNLNTLVIEFSDMLMRTLGDRIDLRLDLRPGLPATKVDPTHLEMALLNVLINARDALPAGGKVTVATSVADYDAEHRFYHLPAGKYVVLCVEDEGTGMDEAVLKRATEPFFTTKGPGTGLGLAMVHGFVQQSNGALDIESEPGKGTVVRMLFPALAAPVASAGSDARGPDKTTGAAQEPAANTILVVDDNPDVLELAEVTLGVSGFPVIAADSGERAIELLAANPSVALVFSDVIMPGGMSGIELARLVREKYPELPVLLTTGYTEELTDDGASRGFDILAKPYTHAELIRRINQALRLDAEIAPTA